MADAAAILIVVDAKRSRGEYLVQRCQKWIENGQSGSLRSL
jgi:hypothetical protein